LGHVADLDGVEPDAGPLVDAGVVGDRAEADENFPGTISLQPAAGVPGTVVADAAIVHPQRPRHANDVLHRDPAAICGGAIVCYDHVVQGQAGIALVADAAATGGRPIHVRPGAVEGTAVFDGEALEG